jgi:hypothetical protein
LNGLMIASIFFIAAELPAHAGVAGSEAAGSYHRSFECAMGGLRPSGPVRDDQEIGNSVGI